MPNLIDITGNKYGRLSVLGRGLNRGDKRTWWKCVCDCGTEVEVRGNYLKNGRTTSCGCYQKEFVGKLFRKHGKSHTKQYAHFHKRMREIRKVTQCPKWADVEKIREIYVNRPDGCHVDHIVPLRGKNVSGLHVEYNLQYLAIKDNLRKQNTYKGVDSWLSS